MESMCKCKSLATCEKADDQTYENDCEAVECTIPHVGQWIKPLHPRGSAKRNKEMIILWNEHIKIRHPAPPEWLTPLSDIGDCCLEGSSGVVWQQVDTTVGRQRSRGSATSDDAPDADPERHSQTCAQTCYCTLETNKRNKKLFLSSWLNV